MDPLDFLRVAQNLSGASQEAEWRTSIGRSYYAVFNHLRFRIELVKTLPKTADAHQLVVRYLTSANNVELQSVGQTLNDLRKSRTDADYEPAKTVAQDQSRLALTKAQKAIAKSRNVTDATFRALMGAQPTYRNQP